MMEKLRDPKNVKFISLLIAAIFVIGCFTIALTSGGFGGNVASAASRQFRYRRGQLSDAGFSGT